MVLIQTVDRQVDPGPVDVILFLVSVEEDNGALVPALVCRLNVSQLDRGSFDELHTVLERRVDVRRETVELDEYRNLYTRWTKSRIINLAVLAKNSNHINDA